MGLRVLLSLKKRCEKKRFRVINANAEVMDVFNMTGFSEIMKELKDRGMWFVCADMDGTLMYDMDLTGPIGLVIGNEGDGVSPLAK